MRQPDDPPDDHEGLDATRAPKATPDSADETGFDAVDTALLGTLRALPPEGSEPRWRELEAAIRAQVASMPMPAPWWKRWHWVVPISALAMATAIVSIVTFANRHSGDRQNGGDVRVTDERSGTEHDTGSSANERDRADREGVTATAVYLAGEAVELDDDTALAALAALSAVAVGGNGELGESGQPDEIDEIDGTDNVHAVGEATGEPAVVESILPLADYRWLDSLDDAALARVEHVLARKHSL